MLRILGRANSFNVRKVLWTCAELQIPFQREDWGRGFTPTSRPEFLAINPIGLVPAVVDNGVVLRESNTIVRYLATKYGGDEIYPKDPIKRAHCEQWMDWANYETSISLRGAFLGGMLKEPPWNFPMFVEQGRKLITAEVGQLQTHLESTGQYMCGEMFTVADITIGLVVNRWFSLDFERPHYPAVEQYFEQLSKRPAYIEFVRNGMP
ncbi:glutathione S-transferase GstB [Variibacter gotjawalensis]|uniref:Glutathione S-transferase GstB n=1 Tax=Variibacter gotjawalensis TaxID=1333996 RepID=A0A0S3PRL5_9BRAD|nr:glutathione S-transferase family protein [Variibacter gotjawalensis]NIK48897.1 glutathione S-transferase [Variibacter gotjawalensis]RZS50752.1 glutathione S-transferase [Variibacter gotjawalensis]BAT58587.1 glutathione S-transferase GstB [Variibacter gotjawalensis]